MPGERKGCRWEAVAASESDAEGRDSGRAEAMPREGTVGVRK